MSNPPVEVVAAPTFIRNLKSLHKKYYSIRTDIQPIIEQLESGKILGQQIPNIGYTVFKLRIKNTDIQKGKRGSYRLIYYLKTPNNVILLTIYIKSQQTDIPNEQLKSIIINYNLQNSQKLN